MTFSEFVDAAATHLPAIRARLVQRHESDPSATSWWITFTRAGCLYRVKFERRTAMLTLEREQGSFVPNSPSTWRLLDTRRADDLSFETALELIDSFLLRFQTPAR